MLHFLLNLCAFCRLASRLAWDRRPCPAPAPAPARTAPARPAGETASRHGTRAARPAPCRQERTTRPAPRPDGHAAARRPYAASLPAQIEQPEPAGNREDIRRGRRRARRETRRKGEDLRPLACRFAVKVIYRPNPAPRTASPAPPQASRHPSPHRLKLPVSRRSPARFRLCQFCFWRVCRTPARFRPSADAQRHPARLPGRHRHRGSLHIFAPAPFLTKRLSTSTLSRTPHIPIFHSGTISTIPQQ